MDHGADYELLESVFRASILRHAPKVNYKHLESAPPEDTSGRGLFCYFNHRKLEMWAEYLGVAKEGEKIIFADSDMLCLRTPKFAFFKDFDIGYTRRVSDWVGNCPINGGIVFAVNNQRTRDFFAEWLKIDAEMLADEDFHAEWVRKYSGLNQSSFGYMLENRGPYLATLEEFPTNPWNCVECDWSNAPDPVFVHIKTRLRREVMAKVRGEKRNLPRRVAWEVGAWWAEYEYMIKGRT